MAQQQYEQILEFDPTAFAPLVTATYFEIVASTTGGAVTTRLFNETAGAAVAGSDIVVSGATVRSRVTVVLPATAAIFRTETDPSPGQTITLSAARIIIDE